jgi:hypothetical protein
MLYILLECSCVKRKGVIETMVAKLTEEEQTSLDGTPEALLAFLEGREPVPVVPPPAEERISELIAVDSQITEKKEQIRVLLEKRRSLEEMNIYTVADILHARHCEKTHSMGRSDDCKWTLEPWESFKQSANPKTSARYPFYERAAKLIKRAAEIGIPIHQALLLDEISSGR